MPGPRPPDTSIFTGEIQMQGIAASGGSTVKNLNFRFAYKRANAALPLSETALETIFDSSVTPTILAALNARYTQTQDVVRFVEDAARPAVTVPRTGVGLVAGDSMAMHLAAYVLKRMAIRGRGSHGSNHFAPISEADTTTGTDDIFNAASIALWATARAAMIAPLTDANGNVWTPVIISRQTPAQYKINPTTVIVYAVSQILLNKRVGRMKKREVQSVY